MCGFLPSGGGPMALAPSTGKGEGSLDQLLRQVMQALLPTALLITAHQGGEVGPDGVPSREGLGQPGNHRRRTSHVLPSPGHCTPKCSHS